MFQRPFPMTQVELPKSLRKLLGFGVLGSVGAGAAQAQTASAATPTSLNKPILESATETASRGVVQDENVPKYYISLWTSLQDYSWDCAPRWHLTRPIMRLPLVLRGPVLINRKMEKETLILQSEGA